MDTSDEIRIALRREIYDANEALVDVIVRLTPVDEDAAGAIKKARSSLFHAWTILCTPPDDPDDDHD